MDLKHHFLIDAGTVMATCVVLGSGAASAAVTPKPHNFHPPKAQIHHVHADPHNFSRTDQT